MNYLFLPGSMASFWSSYERCGIGCALPPLLKAHIHLIVLVLFVVAMLAYWRISYGYGLVGRRLRWALLLPAMVFVLPFIYELGMAALWPKCTTGRSDSTEAMMMYGALAVLTIQMASGLPAVLVASGHRLGASVFAMLVAMLGFCFTLYISFPFYFGDCAPMVTGP